MKIALATALGQDNRTAKEFSIDSETECQKLIDEGFTWNFAHACYYTCFVITNEEDTQVYYETFNMGRQPIQLTASGGTVQIRLSPEIVAILLNKKQHPPICC